MHAGNFCGYGGIRDPCARPHLQKANLFFSIMCKNFLNFLHYNTTCLRLVWFLVIWQRHRRCDTFHFSANIFSLSCQIYIHMILGNSVCFIKENSYCISVLILLSKLMRKVRNISFRACWNKTGWLWMRGEERDGRMFDIFCGHRK